MSRIDYLDREIALLEQSEKNYSNNCQTIKDKIRVALQQQGLENELLRNRIDEELSKNAQYNDYLKKSKSISDQIIKLKAEKNREIQMQRNNRNALIQSLRKIFPGEDFQPFISYGSEKGIPTVTYMSSMELEEKRKNLISGLAERGVTGLEHVKAAQAINTVYGEYVANARVREEQQKSNQRRQKIAGLKSMKDFFMKLRNSRINHQNEEEKGRGSR